MIALVNSRPFRTVYRWQAIATIGIAGIAGALAGWQGAWSALLGGAVSLVAGVVFAFVLGISLGDGRPSGPARPLRAMLRAEAAKVITIVVGLAFVLQAVDDIVHAAFFSAFTVAVILFSMAFFVGDAKPGARGHG